MKKEQKKYINHINNIIMNLCIPRVKSSTNKDYIYKKICNLQAGKIEKIIEIPLKNDPTHKRILFEIQWNNTDTAIQIQDQLKNKGVINIVYDMPWFWKIVTTNSKIKPGDGGI